MDQPASGVWEAQLHIYHNRGHSKVGQFCPPKFDPSKFTLIDNLGYSFDRVQSPDHFGMSMFEIVKKLSDL